MKQKNMEKAAALLCALSLAVGAGGCREQTEPSAGETAPQAGAVSQTEENTEMPAPATCAEIISPAHEAEIVDKINVRLSPDLITPETERITVTVECVGADSVQLALGGTLSKYENEEWRAVPYRTGALLECGEVTVTPEKPYVFEIKLSDYAEPLELLGSYQIEVSDGEQSYGINFLVIRETPPLTEDDIRMTLAESEITPEMKELTLEYEYIGTAEYAEYGFGCDYTLEKRAEDGSWKTVPFSENAFFIDLGYLIGTQSRFNATSVSLSSDFYAEPLTPGNYRVAKRIEDLTLYAEFELPERRASSSLPAETRGSDKSGTETVVMTSCPQ